MSKSEWKKATSITFPRELLERIDDQAHRERRNRSQLVRIAIQDYLERHAPDRKRQNGSK